MSLERNYVVTLKEHGDLQNFYDEMEFSGTGSTGKVPVRAVTCANRRDISRNTHYLLTDEEAEKLRNDPRVLAVELPPEDRGIVMRRNASYTRSGNFYKGTSASAINTDLNWGHLHCAGTVAQRREGTWGSDATTRVNDSIDVWQDGSNVDVVIVDGGVIPGHPEFALNSDGTGGDRFVQYQWFTQLNTFVNSIDNDLQTEPTGTIPYTDADYHGMHVAGTVAGSLRGWANKANIYNLNIFPDDSAIDIPSLLIFDYLRAFHRYKAVNPSTGKRNPTITNHSWGYSRLARFEDGGTKDITAVRYRNTLYSSASPPAAGWTESGLLSAFGIDVFNGIAQWPVRVAAVDADIADAIADGVVVIGAAGNEYTYADISTGQDYNNFVVFDYYNLNNTPPTLIQSGVQEYYMRGSSPGAADNVICVGAMSANANYGRASYSNYGPRIDIWSPGSNIISAYDDASSVAQGGSAQNINDARDANYDLGVISGTSMSSPQVAGIAACMATNRSRIKNSEVLTYLRKYSVTNDMIDATGTGGYTDYTVLGGNNSYWTATNPRPTSGVMPWDFTYSGRPASKQTYPRQNTYKSP